MSITFSRSRLYEGGAAPPPRSALNGFQLKEPQSLALDVHGFVRSAGQHGDGQACGAVNGLHELWYSSSSLLRFSVGSSEVGGRAPPTTFDDVLVAAEAQVALSLHALGDRRRAAPPRYDAILRERALRTPE